ncbi:unnamed protein product [Urochloa decumbens]|uniref:Amine oxidase domain-containing protein n=1 Tax=Urochloa decumbens TaxID=240449 RepID=A0ABC9EYQ9_9POAL
MMRVAVVGGGLGGLAAAHELARSGGARVTVYDKEEHLGGNKAMAVDDGAGGGRVPVDLGCMVFNPMTSPNMMKWFEGLGVEMEASDDMSFSASISLGKGGQGFEWGSRNGLSGVLAQKSNLLSPRFWLVVREILKFKNHALEYLEDHGRNPDHNETLGQFIKSNGYSQLFQDAYLIPMCACIWSSSPQGVLGFPALFVLSFLRDNHLLEAGKVAASELLQRKCDLLVNPKPMAPSWTEAGARLLVLKHFDRYIRIGNMSILEDGGTMFSFGRSCERCQTKTVIQVHDPQFYWKVATEADLGFAYAYIHGYVTFADNRDGLLNLILITFANRGERKRLMRSSATKSNPIRKGLWSPWLKFTGIACAKYILRHASRNNSVSKAAKNISKHYDLSNDFFALYLDPSMTYSSGIFKAKDESLEAAQLRKINSLINKAKVESGHHVLDIGSGWGTLAVELVKKTGCKYTGITLSEEQLKYSKRKVKEAGLEDRITFLLCDYRQIPASQKFDRIISCEMIEHVGHEYMDDFFSSCEYHLAEHGIFVLQFIAVSEELYDKLRKRPEFIKEYIFPGGCLPSLARVVSAMTNSSSFCVQHVENIGDHYYTTLMHWRDNFVANRKKVAALGFDETFMRTWQYYLTYCAAMFKSRSVLDYQMVFSRTCDAKVPSYLVIEE